MSERLSGQDLCARVVKLLDYHLGRDLHVDEVELVDELLQRIENPPAFKEDLGREPVPDYDPPAVELSDAEEPADLRNQDGSVVDGGEEVPSISQPE